MRTKKLSKAEAIKKLRELLKKSRFYGAQSDAIVVKWGSVPKRWPAEIRQQNADDRMIASQLRDEALELQRIYGVGNNANWKVWGSSI
ncbi:MAG TPA: hypothetical protein VJI70_02450 [Candidatus Paceibacterota bacterium]